MRGELTKDYLPLITEDEVIDNCRHSIRTAAGSPVVLTFHDFRGLPGHRLDFAKIVNTLTEKDGFVLIDFDADAAVAASRYRAPDEQASRRPPGPAESLAAAFLARPPSVVRGRLFVASGVFP